MHPYLTAAIPGTGGSIKESPDDFFVEEIPAYLPGGSGEHLHLTIEKRGVTTPEAIRRIAAALKIPERDVGYAGMKDAVGITRQTVSLQKVTAEAALALKLDGIKVLSALRHGNKLKLGHLKGNRFNITIRGVNDQAREAGAAILAVLQQRGVPNYFGYQRYGAQGNSHLIGAAILRRDWQGAVDALIGDPAAVLDEEWRAAITAYRQGDIVESFRLMPRHCRSERDVLQRLAARQDAWERAFAAVHPRMKQLYLSAFQSWLFDKVVGVRLGQIDRVRTGDLAWKHSNGSCFLVEDEEAAAPRAEAFEISASGPMFGARMTQPGGTVHGLEQKVLADAGFSAEALTPDGGVRLEGERRPLRVPLGEVSFRVAGDLLQLGFTLPRGSYATSVVREVTKTF